MINLRTLERPLDQAPPAAPALTLDERLAFTHSAMDERLETTHFAIDINSAHIDLPTLDLADVIRIPVAVPQTPMTASTPVADLLRRAQARILRPGGWSCDTGTNAAGGDCLEYAMQAEARSDSEEREARIYLRRAVGSGDPLPHINRHLSGAGEAGQLFGAAAKLAEQAVR